MPERMSVCCGAPEHPDVPDMCGACNEHTGFEEEEAGVLGIAVAAENADLRADVARLKDDLIAELANTHDLRADVTRLEAERDAKRGGQ